ncbi:MAG TPA: ABC transporter permease [Dehalococcoidia bacterium]
MASPSELVLVPATDARERRAGPWNEAGRRFGRNRPAMIGLAIIAAMALLAALGPLIAPFDPRAQDFHATFQHPSLLHGFLAPGSPHFLDFHSHVFGTDNLGRDWFSRLLYGARLSMTVGVFAQAVVLAIGVPVGLAAGYFGGRVDSLLMRLTDLMFAFPELLLIILLRSLTGGSIYMLFLVIGLAAWTNDARLVRGQVLALKAREFVLAARSLGATDAAIVRRHLLPNAIGPLIVATAFGIPRAILIEASLSFIGIGASPGTPSWGSMVKEGYGAVFAQPHLVIVPAVAISLVMLAFTFAGDGLRDALDPRTRYAKPDSSADLRRRDEGPAEATSVVKKAA